MTPSARTHTGHMQIFFGGSAAFGARGQHAVDFPKEEEEEKDAAPATNQTELSIRALGTWGNGKHSNEGQVNSYWCMDETNTSIPENIILFRGELNEYTLSGSIMSGFDYYKALSIRCVKE